MTPALIVLAAILLLVVLLPLGSYLFFKRRFVLRLRDHAGYSRTPHSAQWDVCFSAASPDDENLQLLREAHKLSDIAGGGSNQERAIRLMNWVHALTSHAVNPSTPSDLTAMNLIRLCQQQGKRINCWMYSIILNECLLSVGISSRMVHLSPPKERPKESHLVVAVYLQDRKKWIMLDPDTGSFFVDEQGDLLGVAEIRERLISGTFLGVSEDLSMPKANWLPIRWRKAVYKVYLSKNIFRISCPRRSDVRTNLQEDRRISYELIPDGYHPEWLKQPRISTNGNALVYINDADLFWQVPVSERI